MAKNRKLILLLKTAKEMAESVGAKYSSERTRDGHIKLFFDEKLAGKVSYTKPFYHRRLERSILCQLKTKLEELYPNKEVKFPEKIT